MTQPFTEALTWVPRSRALGTTLGRAHDLARAQAHAAVTLEHLLLALIEDPDAANVLLACNIDLLSLNTAVAAEVARLPGGAASLPVAAPSLLTILEYAVAAARQSKRSEINGAIVLAAIVGEGRSDAARHLQGMGLRFEDAVQALRRAAATRQPAASGAVEQMEPAAAAPPMQQAAPAPPSAAGPSSLQPSHAMNGHQVSDEDPVTAARRRVEALRAGGPLPQVAASPPTAMPPAEPPPTPPWQPSSGEATASAAPAGDWAPQPAPPPVASARATRLPPPVPPIIQPPPFRTSEQPAPPRPAGAPWSDASSDAAAAAESALQSPTGPASTASTIEPARLIERLPERMRVSAPVPVEIRIGRAAVHATAAAAGLASDAVVTRALTLRLKAPAGGFFIENAALETQWFDARGAMRGDDEVRWRWLVTPRSKGPHPLQLSITMRSVATDGIMIETILPEHQATVVVGNDFRSAVRRWGLLAVAALAGGLVAFAASGGLITMIR